MEIAEEEPLAPLKILYQDQNIVVVSKPGGLLVHRSRESTDRVFLLQHLRDQIGQLVYPVHRLDRAVSGIIAFGLSSESAKHLQESLQHQTAAKKYLVRACFFQQIIRVSQ